MSRDSFSFDDFFEFALSEDEDTELTESSSSDVIIRRIGILNGETDNHEAVLEEFEKTANFIKGKRIPNLKKLSQLVADGKLPLSTVRGIKRLVEMSAGREHGSDKDTFQKQIDTIIKLPFCIFSETYSDFDELEKHANEAVLFSSPAIKKIIRAFRPQLNGSTLQGNVVAIVGPVKSGKSTLINAIIRNAARQPLYFFDCNGINDSLVVDASSYIYNNGNPSQIINILVEMGVANPYVVLDNVDKMSTSNKNGNPAAVMAKWINKNTNKNYIDSFLNVPIDLSSVNFILTAETVDGIPPELKNQAIIIEMGNYELDEKIVICNEFIVKQCLAENDLCENAISFEREAIIKIINEKAFEPGLAELITIVGDIIAKEAETISPNEQRRLTAEYVDEYFKEGNTKAILRLTDSKFESFRRLAKNLPNYPRKEQDIIIEKAKSYEYYLPPQEERFFDLLSKYPRGVDDIVEFNYKKVEEMASDYYGADEPKEQLLTVIARNVLSGKLNGCVMGLIGSPGVGKTNFAQFAAKLLGRPYVAINMNNIIDPSEITGLRDRKIGKIAQAFIDAGSEKPLILFDELEKASTEVQNALLTYLDPLQNRDFIDEYLGITIPIQQAVIIATINDVDRLSFPVYDRLDKIWMDDYSPSDKVEISKRGGISKCLIATGLQEGSVIISDDILMQIAKRYGIGFGYRRMEKALQRIIGSCAREILSKGLDKNTYKRVITEADVLESLGEPLVREWVHNATNKEGVVNGLAAGGLAGDILPIEACVFNGKGDFELTGSMGEVMKESAKVARAVVRKLLTDEGSPIDMSRLGIHLHAPDGAQKKEGPSAGIAIAMALYSAITKQKVSGDLAMSGEINLQGEVLAVGGLEQKLIAAFESGIKTVLLSEENREDVEKLNNPEIFKNQIRYISTFKEAIDIAIIQDSNIRGKIV